MAVRSTKAHWRLSEILPRHWKALSSRHGGARTWEELLDVVERMEPALSAVSDRLPKDFPPSLFDAIAAGCRGQVALFRRHLPAES
jgi:serine/threonine-protein kinase HipA